MNYIIFILLILILLIIIYYLLYFDYHHIVNNLYNGKEYDWYRIGDVLYYPEHFVSIDKQGLGHHLHRYPGSIAEEYIFTLYPFLKGYNEDNINTIHKESEVFKSVHYDQTYKASNGCINIKCLEILNTILLKRLSTVQYEHKKDDLVLHIRTGDTFKLGYTDYYSKTDNNVWWNDFIKILQDNQVKRVIILAGALTNEGIKESAKFLINVKKMLKEYVDIQFRLGKNPDDDILYCYNCNYFVSTGGGYGRLIWELKDYFKLGKCFLKSLK
jgi:hypothetical protein